MSDKLKNILILGFIFELLHIFITNPLNSLLLIVLYAFALLALTLKKEFKLFDKLKEKCPKITNYVVSLGWLWFVSLAAILLLSFFHCSDIDIKENKDCLKLITTMTKYLYYLYLAILGTALGYASSVSFPRKKK